MRRRRNHQGPRVLLLALAGSAVVHGALGLPLQRALPVLLAKDPSDRQKPVEVVRLAPGTYQQALARARAVAGRAAPEARPETKRARAEEKKKPEPKEEELSGQVVEVARSEDRRPPENARYLAADDNRVEKESKARRRDDRRKVVTERLQTRAPSRRAGRKSAVPGKEKEGDDREKGRRGRSRGKEDARAERDAKTDLSRKLEMPKLQRRDAVDLDLDLPRLEEGRVANREGSVEVRGQSDRMVLGLGQKRAARGEADMGDGDGRGKSGGLPSLEDLMPTLGTVARISGSPSDDYLKDVPEGEGTFLNTRRFKYATFFYQVRDSVKQFWRSDVYSELRRRDPTGDVFGPGNLTTMLFIRLDDSGKLSEVRVAESSGYRFLDEVAMRAFRKADTFPNPPKGMVDDQGNINFHFGFTIVTSRRGPLDIFR